ncbi:hypothetical protein [Aliivibrio fischeri]|uniref:Uncharacterized protein n=1 Tax=Aliivibrio fischeri TaxID=668 RepID=A0A510UJZ4_ALIFS|nr:hypothetical protein [Aliivibrio fischeri]GEK13235.1 hypothetical protein AFI02nite_12710 [Aliivibrio fischeri]
MLPIKTGQEALIDQIILASSQSPITPKDIHHQDQTDYHVQFVFEQLSFFGHIRQLTCGRYIRA